MDPPPMKPKVLLLRRPRDETNLANTTTSTSSSTVTSILTSSTSSTTTNGTSSTSTFSVPIVTSGSGSVQLLKRNPAQNNSSTGNSSGSVAVGTGIDFLSQTNAHSRSNQPSPILIQSQDSSGTILTSSSSSTTIKSIAPNAILERPKPISGATGVQSSANALDLLRPFSNPAPHAVPLIDSSLHLLADSAPLRHLIEDSKNTKDFFVVCAIGPPGSGKSTALSYLANPNKESSKFISHNKEDIIFLPRKTDEIQDCTFYISANRTIFIELAPVFSGTTAKNFVGLVQQLGTVEAASVTWNLRLVRWALSVSHLVLLFSEGVADPNLIQLINTAEMVQPVESAFGESVYPEIILVCNKVPMSAFYSATKEKEPITNKTQNKWDYLFRALTGKIPRVSSNIVLLPHNKNNFGFEEHRFQALRAVVEEWDKYNRAPFKNEIDGKPKIPQVITVSEWCQNGSRFWDEMQQQSFFSSYLQSYLKFFP